MPHSIARSLMVLYLSSLPDSSVKGRHSLKTLVGYLLRKSSVRGALPPEASKGQH